MTKESKTHFEIVFVSHYCIDYGGVGHDAASDTYTERVEGLTAINVLRQATEDKYQGEYKCSGYECDGNGKKNYIKSITRVTITTEKLADDSTSKTIVTRDYPIPRPNYCVCKKKYWQIRGEKACHKMVKV